jgi:hypothetical protein
MKADTGLFGKAHSPRLHALARSVYFALALGSILLGALAVPLHAQAPSAAHQSCHDFVQKFYDGYWNQYLPKMKGANFSLPGTEKVLAMKPPVLSQQLIDLIRKDFKESRESGEVGNLDFDPFLNSQDPRGTYLVGTVEVAGGVCHAAIPRAHIVADLKPAGSSWIFVNFHYSYYKAGGKTKDVPDSDLLQILNPPGSGAKTQK